MKMDRQIKTILPLIFLGIAQWSFAQQNASLEPVKDLIQTARPLDITPPWFPGYSFHVVDSEPMDSQVEIYGQVPGQLPKESWARADFTKESGEQYYFYTPVADGSWHFKINLRTGQGSYKAQISVSPNGDKFNVQGGTVLGEFTLNNLDSKDWTYLAPSQEVQSDALEITELTQKITEGIIEPMAQIKAVHDWVTTNIKYDKFNYFKWVIGRPMSNYDALATLRNQKGVCLGYANLYAALLRPLGFRTKVVEGAARHYDRLVAVNNKFQPIYPDWNDKIIKENPHAWNEVLIGDRWVIVDPTFDAVSWNPSIPDYLKINYFDPSPELFAQDHLRIKERHEDPK